MEKAVPLSKSDPMNGGMEFNGQELLEVSAVTVPSNPDALQRMVKAPNLQPVLREIAEERLGETVDDTTETTHTLSSEDLELIVDQVLDRLDQASADDEKGPGYKPRKQEDEDEEPDDEEADEDDDDEAEDDTEAEEDEDEDEEKSEFDAYAVALAAAQQALQEAE